MDPADLDLLLRLADAADELTAPAWRDGRFEVRHKDDGSPVTATDVAVEEELRRWVARAHPDDGFCGEEVGATTGRSGRTWIVDGIDGTRAFVAGRVEWSTLIALVEGDRPLLGVVTSPGLGRRWIAPADGSALAGTPDGSSTPLVVSDTRSLDGARVASWPAPADLDPQLRLTATRLVETVGAQPTRRRSWDAQVPNSAMLVADGRLDAFVFFAGGPWDHAAPAAVVTAAGGRFSALDGSGSLHTGAGVYSNGHIHGALLRCLAS